MVHETNRLVWSRTLNCRAQLTFSSIAPTLSYQQSTCSRSLRRDEHRTHPQHPPRRRPARESCRAGGDPDRRRRTGRRDLGRGGAARSAGARFCGGAAGRAHADHERLRAGRTDPPAPAHPGLAYHFPDRRRRRRVPAGARLCARGGRLHDQALQPGGAARQGIGIHRPVPQERAAGPGRGGTPPGRPARHFPSGAGHHGRDAAPTT